MWFVMALSSAFLLGFYDVFKKQSLRANAVIPVLFFNALISALLFLPLVFASYAGMINPASHWCVPSANFGMHAWVLLKVVIVLSSWACGYFAIKHLPLTLVGPVNATRPVMTLVGALLVYGEVLNLWQWGGVVMAIVAFFLMSRNGKLEGIDFVRNRWVSLLVLAAVLGALSGLYDKYLLSSCESGGLGLSSMFVQGWFNLYQLPLMAVVLVLWQTYERHRSEKESTASESVSACGERFQWRWTILGISLFLIAADMCYFYALTFEGALIAVVSMTRRTSVLVSFLFGAFLMHEKNIGRKAVDLLLVFVSLVLLCLGAVAG